MIWSAWNNGSHSRSGGGFGLHVPTTDRKREFQPSWKSVRIELPSSRGHQRIAVPISPSFWRTCNELRGQDIGRWLVRRGHCTWSLGAPPRFEVKKVGRRRFRVIRRVAS